MKSEYLMLSELQSGHPLEIAQAFAQDLPILQESECLRAQCLGYDSC